MKRIIAFVKPNMLDEVIFALHAVEGFRGATISEVQEIGSSPHPGRAERTPLHAFPKIVRMELVCTDEQSDEIVKTVRAKAHTGLPDDGMIYISPVGEAVGIRTSE